MKPRRRTVPKREMINVKDLKTRTLTGIVFAAIMMLGLFINGYTFVLLITVIMFGCLFEFAKLIKLIKPNNYRPYLLFAIPYIIIPFIMLISLGLDLSRSRIDFSKYNHVFPAATIFVIWVNDSFAYISGSVLGYTPLSKISPKKTWEGVIIGGLTSIFFTFFFCALLNIGEVLKYDYVFNIGVMVTIAAIVGPFGDLLESKLKRLAGVKDSGSFMPGHGGFLDRFDSLIVIIPFVWVYINLFVR